MVVVASKFNNVWHEVVALDHQVLDDYVGHGILHFDTRNGNIANIFEDRGKDDVGEVLDEVFLELDIELKKSKHKVLFTVFKPLLFRTVRPVLQKVLEKQVRDAFTRGDAFAYEVHQEAKRAKERAAQEIKENPQDAPNTYNRYMSAFRARMEERKRQAQQSAEQTAKRDTKVQTTTTLSGSLFPDIKLPGGITTKASEYEELAKKGERWESPIFSIGSASESTDIPKPDAITRKPHSATETRLRDRNATGGAADGATTGTSLTNGGTAVTNGQAKHYDSTLANDVNGTTAQGTATVSGTHTAFNPQTA